MRLVVRIEHLRDRLRLHLVLDRAVVVAVVERREVERLDGLGFPQAQRVAGADAVAEDRRVVGDARTSVSGIQRTRKRPCSSVARLGAPAELHLIRDLRARDLPRIAVAAAICR